MKMGGVDQAASSTTNRDESSVKQEVVSADKTKGEAKDAKSISTTDQTTAAKKLEQTKLNSVATTNGVSSNDTQEQTGVYFDNNTFDGKIAKHTLNISYSAQAGDVISVHIPFKGMWGQQDGDTQLPATVASVNVDSNNQGATIKITMNATSTFHVSFHLYDLQTTNVTGIDPSLYNITQADIGPHTYQVTWEVNGKEQTPADFVYDVEPSLFLNPVKRVGGTNAVKMGTDHTYSVDLSDRIGINYYNRVPKDFNAGSVITIPVASNFELNKAATDALNTLNDGTEITQDGVGKDIVITIPKGKGVDFDQTSVAPYYFVGHFNGDQPDQDTPAYTPTGAGISATVNYSDTYSKTASNGTFVDTLLGKTTEEEVKKAAAKPAEQQSTQEKEQIKNIYGDVTTTSTPKRDSQILMLDHEKDDLIGSFGYSVNSADSFTNGSAQFSFTFSSNQHVYKVTTPESAGMFLSGVKTYQYRIVRADNTVQTGQVNANEDIVNTDSSPIVSLTLTPDQLLTGANATNDQVFKFYGKITTASGSQAGDKLDSSFSLNGTVDNHNYTSSSELHQTVGQQTSTLQLQSTGTMTVAPGGQIGYLYTTLGNSSVTRLGTVYEPTIYCVMPKGISAQKLSGLYVQNFQGVVPKISEFKNSDGSYTVKVDYKGTGFTYDFANQEKDDAGRPKLLGFWIQALPDAAKGSYAIKAYIDTTTPMDKTTNPASSNDVKTLLGLTNDNQLYDLGSFTANVGLGDSETGVTLTAGPDGIWRQSVQATNKKGENLQFAYSVINTSSKELSNNHIILSLPSGQGGNVGSQHPDKYGRTMTFRLTAPIQLPDDLKNAEVKYSTQDFNFTGNMSDISDLSSFVSADQVTDWNSIKTIEIYLPTIAANSQSGRIVLNGQDPTAEGDFNGTGFLANGLYSDSMAPQIVTQINSTTNPNQQIAATIRINGLVKVPVKLVKADGTKIEISSMEKEYNPNDSSLIISQDYPQANIPADLITANVQPGYGINGPVFTNGSGSNLSWGVTVSTTGGQEIDFYVEAKKITVSGKTPDGPKTPDTPLPDNPSKNYPEHVDKQALYKEVTRTINVYNKDKQLVGSKTETLKLYRTATVNEATGKVEEYSEWQMVTPTTSGWDKYLFGQVQSGDLIKVEVTDEDGHKLTTDPVSGETIPTTEMSADNIQSPIIKQTDSEGNSVYGVKEVSVDDLINTINQKQAAGDTVDINVNEIVNVNVGPAQVTSHVYWVDTQTPDTSSDGKDGLKLVHKQDVTDYPGTKATLDKLPENYDYADGQDPVTEITNNGQDVVIRLKHKTSTTPYTKTVTRIINITKPGEETKTTKQTVTFSKTDSTDLVSKQTTEGKWTRTSENDKFTGLTTDDLKVDHYTTKITKNGETATVIPAETVTVDSSDETFDVTYAPINKSETVYWVDTETKDQAGQEGYKVVDSEQVPEQLEGSIYQLTKSTPENYVLADGQADIKSVTVDGNNVIIKLKHGTKTVPETITVTRVVYVTKPNATKASKVVNTAIEFTRDNVVDAVDGHVIGHGDWDPDSAVINGYTPTPQDHYKVVIHKGTPDGETVQSIDQINDATADTPSDIYYVTYAPINKSETVYWLDTETQDPAGQKGLKVVQSEDTPSQIEDSSYQLTKSTPTNYVLADGQADIKSVTVDGNNVYIMLKHGTTQGTEQTKTVNRTVYEIKPDETEPTVKYNKTLTFTRIPTVDAVTPTKVVNEGTWVAKDNDTSWTAVTPDEVPHYNAVIHEGSADGNVVDSIAAKTDVDADTANEIYYVTYNPINKSETVYWLDTETPDTSDQGQKGLKVVDSEQVPEQLEGNTYTLTHSTPTNYVLADGQKDIKSVTVDGNNVYIMLKHGTTQGTKETKTLTRIVYVTKPGETEPTKKYDKSIIFTRTPTVDAVDHTKVIDPGTWTLESGSWDAFTPDKVDHYTPVIHKDSADGQEVNSIIAKTDVNADTPNETYYVTYTPVESSETIYWVDTQTPDTSDKGYGGYKVIQSENAGGQEGSTYTIKSKTPEDGYIPVGEVPTTVVLDGNDVIIKMKHGTKDGEKETKTVTRTVYAIKPGETEPTKVFEKSVEFSRTPTLDAVNGDKLSDGTWSPEKGTLAGYTPADQPNYTAVIHKDSATGQVVDSIPENDDITINSANEVYYVTYTANAHSLTVIVHDNNTDTDLTDYGFSGSGDPNTDTGYDWTTVKQNLQNKGYQIVNDQTIPTTYGTSDATYTINVQHGTKAGETETKTVTRTVYTIKPGETEATKVFEKSVEFSRTPTLDAVSGDKISDGTWAAKDNNTSWDPYTPENLDHYTAVIHKGSADGNVVDSIAAKTVDINTQNEVYYVTFTAKTKTVTKATSQTVHYQGAEGDTPADNVQNDYTFTGTQNEATGQTTWNEESHTYGNVTTPLVPGYVADKASVDGATVTPDNPTSTTTVTYTKVGQIIPVDEKNNEIPGATPVNYKNDPKDPTKVIPTDIPTIPGYTAKVTTVTPSDPTKNTTVVYTKDTATHTVVWVDDDINDTTSAGYEGKLVLHTEPLTGTKGENAKVTYTLPEHYTYAKGYQAVTEVPLDGQTTYIHVVHEKQDKTDTKKVNRTVNITKPGEKNVSTTETVTLTKTDSVDLVTGKPVKEGTWTPDKKGFDATSVEPIDGFKLKITETVDGQTHDVTSIPAEEVTENSQDEIFDITYLPTGKSLEPLVSREVTRTVTITKPGEKPITKTQTVTFSGSQNPDGTITWDNDPKLENKFNAVPVDSVDGYKAVIKDSDGKLVQSIDDENLNPATAKDETFTVTYEKIETPAPEPTPQPSPAPTPAPSSEPTPTPEPTPTSNPKPAANTHPENVKPEIHPSLTMPNVVKENFNSAKPVARRINKVNSAAKAEKLPQTGESKTNGSLLGLLGLGMSMALGLVSRKKKEDK